MIKTFDEFLNEGFERTRFVPLTTLDQFREQEMISLTKLAKRSPESGALPLDYTPKALDAIEKELNVPGDKIVLLNDYSLELKKLGQGQNMEMEFLEIERAWFSTGDTEPFFVYKDPTEKPPRPKGTPTFSHDSTCVKIKIGGVDFAIWHGDEFSLYFVRIEDLIKLVQKDLIPIECAEPFLSPEEKKKYAAQFFAKKHNL